MRPLLSADNIISLRIRYIVFGSKTRKWHWIRSIILANAPHGILGKFGKIALLAPSDYLWMKTKRVLIALGLAISSNHICHIFGLAALPQVCRVAARRIVTGMENVQQRPSARNQIKNDSRDKAGQCFFIFTKTNVPMSKFESAALPFPAITFWPLAHRLVDIIPNSLNVLFRKFWRVYSWRTHNLNPLSFFRFARAAASVQSAGAACRHYNIGIGLR